MAVINWSTIFNKYRGLWVALLDDEETVVGSGKTAREAKDNAEKGGHKDTILTRLPDELVTFVGHEL